MYRKKPQNEDASGTDQETSKTLGIRGNGKVNDVRAQNDLSELEWSDILHDIAYPHSKD